MGMPPLIAFLPSYTAIELTKSFFPIDRPTCGMAPEQVHFKLSTTAAAAAAATAYTKSWKLSFTNKFF